MSRLITVRAPESLVHRVEAYAAEHELDLSAAVRRLLADGLDRATLAAAAAAGAREGAAQAADGDKLAAVLAGPLRRAAATAAAWAVGRSHGLDDADLAAIVGEVRRALADAVDDRSKRGAGPSPTPLKTVDDEGGAAR